MAQARKETLAVQKEDGDSVKKSPIIPLDDRIVIDVDPAVEMSPGGLHLPETAVTRLPYGTAIAVGPGRFDPIQGKRIPMSVKAGDRVLYERMQGVIVEGPDDTKFMCVREHSIVGVIR